MRTSKFFALGVIFLAIVSYPAVSKTGKESVPHALKYPYYVVIGAFAIHQNAINFTATAVKNNYSAKFEINKNRNLYYVYVMSTDNVKGAIAEALRLRKESPYFDTWVFNGLLGEAGADVVGTDINPVSSEKIEDVQSSNAAPQASAQTPQASAEKQSVTATVTDSAVTQPDVTEPVAESEKPKEEPAPTGKLESRDFVFKILRADDKAQVEGDINIIDAERSRKMGTYKGNQQVNVSNPKNKEGKISLVCEVFGYRKIQRDVNYNAPEGEGIITDENNATVIPFELVRLQKGDIAVMYNVFFFKDAAVMRPESRYEITSLLTMLQENPNYKIRLHGHTNGGAHGKIISLNEGSQNYFSLTDTKEGVGSAKKLSQERAEVIRSFLASNGIDMKRMQIKSWGGKRSLYDKNSPQAQSNVRVEIEILEN